MSESRWAHGLFASSADLREQANQPMQLTLVRRGVFVGTGELSESLDEVHRQHPELGDTRVFQQEVRPFVDEALRTGRFELTRGQMEAIRTYTLPRPQYFDMLNKLLYGSQNAVFDSRLNVWLELLFNLDTGLKTLQRRHVAEGTSARVLYRVAWIPSDVYQQHFQVNNPVVFKGCTSTSTQILEDFYFAGLANPAEIEGKCCLVLEFDDVSSRQAVDIRFLSAVQVENEWLLPPCSRARVVSDMPFEQFPSGYRPSPHPVRHLKLTGLERVEAIPDILEWNGGIGIGKLLQLAIFIAAHQDEHCAWLCDTLLQVEQYTRAAASPRWLETTLIETWHKFTMFRESLDPAVVSAAATAVTTAASVMPGMIAGVHRSEYLLACAGVTAYIFRAMGRTKAEAASQRTAGTPLTPGQLLVKEVAGELAKQLRALGDGIEGSPEDILHKLETNLPGHALLRQQVMDGSMEETELIRCLGTMLLEASLIEKIVIGQPREVICVLSTCFPVLQSKEVNSPYWQDKLSAAQRRGLRPFTPMQDTELFHPVLAEIEVGDKLLAAPVREDLEALEAAKSLLASVDHMRLALSRTRIVFTLGPPDSGKTTLLNRVFGLELPAGLGPRGRTKMLTLTPCPDMPNILLADVPGFGDGQHEARNDVVRLMVSLAEIKGLMQILVVLKSGRHEQHPVDDLVKAVSSMGVPVSFVITQADKLYLEYSQGEKPADVQDSSWWQQNADEIKGEDASRVTSLLPNRQRKDILYTCLAGKFSRYAAPSATSSISPVFQAAFHTHFQDVLVSAEDLRDRILGPFRPVP